MAYKYFLFSSTQLNNRIAIEKKMGKTFFTGTVFNKGRRCSFTELSDSPTNQYSDTKVVAEGEISTFRYKMPSSK